MHALFVKI